jgi:hypothetical protein
MLELHNRRAPTDPPSWNRSRESSQCSGGWFGHEARLRVPRVCAEPAPEARALDPDTCARLGFPRTLVARSAHRSTMADSNPNGGGFSFSFQVGGGPPTGGGDLREERRRQQEQALRDLREFMMMHARSAGRVARMRPGFPSGGMPMPFPFPGMGMPGVARSDAEVEAIAARLFAQAQAAQSTVRAAQRPPADFRSRHPLDAGAGS